MLVSHRSRDSQRCKRTCAGELLTLRSELTSPTSSSPKCRSPTSRPNSGSPRARPDPGHPRRGHLASEPRRAYTKIHTGTMSTGWRRPKTFEEADSASSDGRADSGPIMSTLAGPAIETLTARAGQAGSCPRPCGGRVHQFETGILTQGKSSCAPGRGEFLPSMSTQWETLPYHVASGNRRGDRALARSRH